MLYCVESGKNNERHINAFEHLLTRLQIYLYGIKCIIILSLDKMYQFISIVNLCAVQILKASDIDV